MSTSIPTRSIVQTLAIGLLAFGLLGCQEWTASRLTKVPTSALWVGQGGVLEASDLTRLQEAGVDEIFFYLGKFDPDADGGPLVIEGLRDVPGGIPLTMAISGQWSESLEAAEELAEQTAEAAKQLRFDVGDSGALPVGLHFDFTDVSSFESLTKFLEVLRKKFERDLFLSFSVQREWLSDPGLADAVGRVDFIVPFLYGQRIREAEDPQAWDFVELERNIQKLEDLDSPYMIGIVTLGTATHLDARGSVKARMTPISLQEILWNRDLSLRPGFSLEGSNRRVYSVEAEKPTTVNKWELEVGDVVRVVRAATTDLEGLDRILETLEMPNHLGQLYYRLPRDEERLSLSLDNLLDVFDDTPAEPDLLFDASLQRRTGRGWLMRFSITNRNDEITELSLVDSNYLQARCLNCVFGKADPGDFYRYDLYKTNSSGELERTFRRSDLIRFHVPILEGEQNVTSGDVETHLRGEPRVEIEGRFLLPDGRYLEIPPTLWPSP